MYICSDKTHVSELRLLFIVVYIWLYIMATGLGQQIDPVCALASYHHISFVDLSMICNMIAAVYY